MGEFFVRRPVVAIVIAIVMVIAGVVAIGRLPVAQFPDIVPPEVQVTTKYTGADALTLEQSVATPIEQRVNGVDNMLYVTSTSGNDGTLTIKVTFEVGTDIDMDNVLVQNRVSEATPSLPADTKNYGITVKKSLGMPFLVVSLYSPKGTYDGYFLGNYATINVIDELARIPGVGQVKAFGTSDYALRIWVRPDQLARLGLSIQDLANAIRRQSTVNPAGQIGGEPAPSGQELTYSVRAQGRLVTPEEFAAIIVREDADGAIVRLGDVARIDLGVESYMQRGRLNGAEASILTIYQAPGSNALAVADGVKSTMESLKKRFPADLDYAISLDTTLPISEGINEILHTLLEAVALVILVVFVFLQSWRATLIPLLTVPVSLVGAFMVFPLLGFSVNTLSLFGLVLAIGLVVDDAIVVVEAVEHNIEHGMNPRDATLKAMKEVSGPVVAIALVLSAVFIPVAFLGGITGRLYQQFALTIAISMMLSAFNALSLSPALCSRLLKPRKQGKSLLQKFYGAFNRGFEKTTGTYVSWTGHLLRKLVLGVALLVAFAVAAGGLGLKVPSGFVPEEDQGYLFVNVQLPAPASLQRTDEACRRIEEILADTEGVKTYNAVAGYSLLTNVSAPYNAFFFVQLKPWEERHGKELHAKAIAARLNAAFRRLPEAVAVTMEPPAIPGIGMAGGFSFQLQDTSGGSVADLDKQLQTFLQVLRSRPEIGNAFSLFNAQEPQIFVNVDREKMLRQGVDPAELYGTLQAVMGGLYVNDFNRFGRQWRVYLAGEPEFRRTADDIGQIFVKNGEGKMVPLSSLTQPTSTAGPAYVTRFNLFRSAEILGSGAPGYSSGQVMAAIEDAAKQSLPGEFRIAWNALSYQEKKAPPAGPTFAMAVLFVFLILAAQYESWSLPFSVLLVVPAGVAGAFLALLLQKVPFDVFGQVGLIMLVGLSAKNAILIVEFAKLELEKGVPAIDAALNAARLRLRPILMTAFAFILGCVPLLTASGAGAASRYHMGTVVVFGSLAATFLGIFLTPVLFVLVESIVGRLRHKGSPGEGGAPEPVVAEVPAPEAS